MGLLDNQGVKNPAKKFIRFSGKTGRFNYWDGEKNVDVEYPVSFVALSDLASVSGGYTDSQGKYVSIYSNMVTDQRHILTVKDQKGTPIARGVWAEIKDKVKSSGGKFCINTLAVMDDEIVCFQFTGSSLSAWINKPKGDMIVCDSNSQEKKGAVTYYVPVFKARNITENEETDIMASDFVEQVKSYKESLSAPVSYAEPIDDVPAPEEERTYESSPF